MTMTDIAHQRLHNHQLIDTRLKKPEDVAHQLGAVQSQDFFGALWALGQRMHIATENALLKAFDEGKILRTHVMRPTWHFVHPSDIHWLLMLTAPRVHAFNAYYYRKVGLDENLLKLSKTILTKVLKGGKQLTRDEISLALKEAGIKTTGMSLRFPYILMHAELDGLICSGPRVGKQFTYMLLEERAPKKKELSREEALVELTTRYFTSHGPATMQDFAWWSGFSVTDVKKGIAMVGSKLHKETIDSKEYWFAHNTSVRIDSPVVHLLPNYDEYVIAYKDRGAYSQRHLTKTPTYQDLSYHIIVINGQIVGGWKKIIKPDKVILESTLFLQPSDEEHEAIQKAVKEYSEFLNLPAEILFK